jgi:hypothetical protein
MKLIAIALLALLPLVANANLQVQPGTSISCSGNLSVFAGDAEPSKIDCLGNLSFEHGSIFSSTPFSISATNKLSFLDVLVAAPELTLTAGNSLFLDSYSTLASPLIELSADSLTLNGTITTSVPEPSSWVLWSLGLGFLLQIRRSNKQIA